MTDGALTCHEVVDVISDYLDGAMGPDDRRRVEAHLELCDGCRAYLEQMRETIRLTGMLTEEQIPADQRDALLEAFRGWSRSGSSDS